ncbi:MAG: glucan biosynthesis protein G [Candidatus Omnitrophica bacterium]|nr:glucan biosynthesis protein G [Candidatus Omnitrophota bacterium]
MDNESESYQRTVRRSLLALGLFCCLCLTGASHVLADGKRAAAPRVQLKDVIAKAKALSAKPFQAPGTDLPEVLKKMGYDQWRGIRFKPARSLWVDQPFSVQFFHPGFLYQFPVTVHSVDRDGTREVPFSPDLFEYEDTGLKGRLQEDHGFAGFRVHYPLNTPKYADELVSFLGASYFRALGKDLAYGLSARGLAVDTAEDTGEEFPLFREFWIVHPALGDKGITFYALLDSNSVTGAYEFLVTPGEETVMKVKSVLFVRQHIRKLGIAPLTSMFSYGENAGLKGNGDFRPEVHDSDGLLVFARSGEWIWHPLVNPPRLLVNAFGGDQPVGFGLLQRDIDFDHYQDLEARYERRPSVWVTPQGDWGKGHLELVQIPSESEYNDNIVTYWVPERALEAGDSVSYAYMLSWHSARHRRFPQGFVDATRIVKKADGAMFLIDFTGEEFKTVLANKELKPDVWVSRGARITDTQLMRNPVTGGWRLVLHVQWDTAGFMEGLLPNQKPAVEFRAFLKDGALAVTETWSYTCLP